MLILEEKVTHLEAALAKAPTTEKVREIVKEEIASAPTSSQVRKIVKEELDQEPRTKDMKSKLQQIEVEMSKANQDRTATKDLEKRLSSVEEEMKKMKQEGEERRQQVLPEGSTSSSQANDKPSYATMAAKTARSQVVRDSLGEIQERNKRKLNLILYNVPESTSDNVEERKTHDLSEAKNILNVLGVKATLHKPIRLAKSKIPKHADKPRPLRVAVSSEEERRTILQALKITKEGIKSKMKDVFIVRDMTPLERQERQEQAQARRMKQEDQDVTSPKQLEGD